MLEEIKNKIREIGIQEEKVQETLDILSEEVLDNLFSQLTDISTDEELEAYARRMEESKSPEHLQTIINEIAVTVYSEEMEKELKNDYFLLIEELGKTVKAAQDLVQKAQAGDPEAIKLMEKAQQTEAYKDAMASEE